MIRLVLDASIFILMVISVEASFQNNIGVARIVVVVRLPDIRLTEMVVTCTVLKQQTTENWPSPMLIK